MALSQVSSSSPSILSRYALEALKVLGGSLFLACASQISFMLPFTPIMVTMQTMALFMMGYALGPKKAALSVLLYLGEGALGLPVFALGQSSLAVLMGPKGGYYLGYCATAFIAGFARKETSLLKLLLIFLAAETATLLLGLSWLSVWVGTSQALILGLYPFIIGDLLKIAAASALIKGTHTLQLNRK